MNKLILVFLFLYQTCLALPDWVQEVLDNNKNISTHQDASVLIYLNNCEIKINDGGSAEFKFRKIIKILKKDAIFNHSFFSLPTTSTENVDNFSAWIIRTDGSENEIDDDGLISLSAPEHSAYFDDDQLIFALIPQIGVGTIVAYEYEIVEEGETSFFQEFIFHNKEPVVSSCLQVEIPDGWSINFAASSSELLNQKHNNNIYTWCCNNVVYEQDEELSPPQAYLQKKILINCFNTLDNDLNNFSSWASVSRWCDNYFFTSAEVDDNIRALSKEITVNCITNKDKLLAIAEFVQNDIRYVAIEIGKNKWIPRKASITLRNRYGDCKDKTALMISLLSAIGIKSCPILVSSLKPIYNSIPSPYQFNHVIIGVPVEQLDNTKNLYNAIYNNYLLFDPTNEHIELGQLPPEIIYSGAVIGKPDGSDLFFLDKISLQDFMNIIECDAQIDSAGILSCVVELKYFNALGSTFSSELKYRSNDEQKEFFQYLFDKDIPNLKIIELSSEKLLDTLTIRIRLTSKDYVQMMDSIWVIKSQILDIPTLPVLKPIERNYPIWLGGPRSIQILTEWEFPNKYVCVTDTLNISSEIMGFKTEYHLHLQNRSANAVSKIEYSGLLIDKEYYLEVIAYSKKLFEIKNQIITLKKIQ